MASLDESASTDEPIQVMFIQDDNAYLLCTLQRNKIKQCQLDLNFSEGSKVCFSTKGNGIVHLTGYLIPDEFGMDDMGEEEESEMASDEDETEQIEDLRNVLKDKKKKDKKEDKVQENNKNKKEKPKAKPEVVAGDSDSSDDEDYEEGEEEQSDDSGGLSLLFY
jgi:FK506-binding nuclear protein